MNLNKTLTLGLLLLCSASSAQTLLDTSAAMSVQNTLMQTQPSVPKVDFDICKTSPQFCADGTVTGAPSTPAASAPAAAPAPVTPAQAAPAANQAAPTAAPVKVVMPPAAPLTAAQQKTLADAYTAYRGKDLKMARQMFESLIAQNYAHPDPHFGLGVTLLTMNNLKGASFEFEQLRTIAPERFEGPYNLGVIAVREGRHADALRLFGEAAALTKGKASPAVARQVLEALAAEQVFASDMNGLTTTLSDIVALNPSDSDAQLRLAQAMTLTGQGLQALPAVYTVLQKQPERTDAAMLLADIYLAQGLPERATRELDSAIAKSKSANARAELLLYKSRILAKAGDAKGALKIIQDASRADNRNPAIWAGLGQIRALNKDLPGAVAAYQQAARLDNKNPEYFTSLALVRLAAGQYKEALQTAATGLKLKPNMAQAGRLQYVQGVAAYRTGQYGLARDALRSSVTTVPSAEAYQWLGMSAYALKNYAEASMALAESVKLKPTATNRLNLGSALLADKRGKEAQEILTGLVTEQPTNAEAWYQLGLAQRLQGQETEAKASLKKAANLGHTKAKVALQ